MLKWLQMTYARLTIQLKLLMQKSILVFTHIDYCGVTGEENVGSEERLQHEEGRDTQKEIAATPKSPPAVAKLAVEASLLSAFW